MPELPIYFTDFLKEISLTGNQKTDCIRGHKTLRERLDKDEKLKGLVITHFLQGSYKRSTAVRPVGNSRSDVDIIVVTNIDNEKMTPQQALDLFKEFLEKHYKGKYKPQGRSWGIELSYVDMDLVPTSAPSEMEKGILESISNDEFLEDESNNYLVETNKAAKWKSEPLLIPNREANKWDQTDPLAQIEKTKEKNRNTNGHYVNIVKCVKWWRKAMTEEPKYPKSYPLEHLICLHCPDKVSSIAEGIVEVFTNIRDTYKSNAILKETPFIPDHGVPDHNVFGRVEGKDFAAFHKLISDAADLAKKAFNETDTEKSVNLWRELFGTKFPPYTKPNKTGYTERKEESNIPGGRFA